MSDNPMIAFDCGECMGRGSLYSSKPDYSPIACVPCHGSGKLRLTLDDLAERIAGKIITIPGFVHASPYYLPPDECPPVLPEPV